MGGEESTAARPAPCQVGLPPRGRGRGRPDRRGTIGFRITPAWAGKSSTWPTVRVLRWDYPRVGGEELITPCLLCAVEGLPPRGRGRECPATREDLLWGITPAWAGKSLNILVATLSQWDYPRVGGEEPSSPCTSCNAAGLPPRGRGRGLVERDEDGNPRITPAWAGKRALAIDRRGHLRDYPRVGGEEMAASRNTRKWQGLPPRGRGRVHAAIRGFAHMGITPAWAGKSLARLAPPTRRRDYPRVGGEEPGLVDHF